MDIEVGLQISWISDFSSLERPSAGIVFPGSSPGPSPVSLILPLFFLVPSGNLPPAVASLGRAHRCSSQGKDAPLGGVGFWGVAGNYISACPAFCSDRDSINANLSCYSPWFSMRSNLRWQIKAWRNVVFGICCWEQLCPEILPLITCWIGAYPI